MDHFRSDSDQLISQLDQFRSDPYQFRSDPDEFRSDLDESGSDANPFFAVNPAAEPGIHFVEKNQLQIKTVNRTQATCEILQYRA